MWFTSKGEADQEKKNSVYFTKTKLEIGTTVTFNCKDIKTAIWLQSDDIKDI